MTDPLGGEAMVAVQQACDRLGRPRSVRCRGAGTALIESLAELDAELAAEDEAEGRTSNFGDAGWFRLEVTEQHD